MYSFALFHLFRYLAHSTEVFVMCLIYSGYRRTCVDDEQYFTKHTCGVLGVVSDPHSGSIWNTRADCHTLKMISVHTGRVAVGPGWFWAGTTRTSVHPDNTFAFYRQTAHSRVSSHRRCFAFVLVCWTRQVRIRVAHRGASSTHLPNGCQSKWCCDCKNVVRNKVSRYVMLMAECPAALRCVRQSFTSIYFNKRKKSIGNLGWELSECHSVY